MLHYQLPILFQLIVAEPISGRMTALLGVSELVLTECMTRSFFTSLWLVLTHWLWHSEQGRQEGLEIRSMSTFRARFHHTI